MNDPRSTLERAIVAVVAALLGTLLVAWLLMLALGAVHSLLPEVPPLGFWTVFALLLGLDAYMSLRQYLAKRRAIKKDA